MFPNEDHLHLTDDNNNWASFADGTQLLDKLCYINLFKKLIKLEKTKLSVVVDQTLKNSTANKSSFKCDDIISAQMVEISVIFALLGSS